MWPSRQRRYDLAMAVTRIPALHFAHLLKSSKYLCRGSNGSLGVVLGSTVALEPLMNLRGERLTRQGVAEKSLDPATSTYVVDL